MHGADILVAILALAGGGAVGGALGGAALGAASWTGGRLHGHRDFVGNFLRIIDFSGEAEAGEALKAFVVKGLQQMQG